MAGKSIQFFFCFGDLLPIYDSCAKMTSYLDDNWVDRNRERFLEENLIEISSIDYDEKFRSRLSFSKKIMSLT